MKKAYKIEVQIKPRFSSLQASRLSNPRKSKGAKPAALRLKRHVPVLPTIQKVTFSARTISNERTEDRFTLQSDDEIVHA